MPEPSTHSLCGILLDWLIVARNGYLTKPSLQTVAIWTMIAIALIAMACFDNDLLAIATLLGVSYAVVRLLPRRIIITLGVFCLFLATLPWFGIGGYEIAYPDSSRALPLLTRVSNGYIEIPGWLNGISIAVRDAFEHLYHATELPLFYGSMYTGRLFWFIQRPGMFPAVRPFAYFTIYGSIGLVCLVAAVFRSSLRIRFQFSILTLLIITSVTAFFLGFMTVGR